MSKKLMFLMILSCLMYPIFSQAQTLIKYTCSFYDVPGTGPFEERELTFIIKNDYATQHIDLSERFERSLAFTIKRNTISNLYEMSIDTLDKQGDRLQSVSFTPSRELDFPKNISMGLSADDGYLFSMSCLKN